MAPLKDLGEETPLHHALYILQNMHYKERNQSQKHWIFLQVLALHCDLWAHKKTLAFRLQISVQRLQSFLGCHGQECKLRPNSRAVLCHQMISSEVHHTTTPQAVYPCMMFSKHPLVNTTPKTKGGLNNAFFTAQTIAKGGSVQVGDMETGKIPSQVSYENNVYEDKFSLQVTNRTQIRCFRRKLGRVHTLERRK